MGIKINNNKNSNRFNNQNDSYNLHFLVDSRDRCIVSLDQKGSVVIA